MRGVPWATAILLAAAASAAGADMVILKDGRVVEGIPVTKEADALLLRYPSGEVRLPLSLVEDFLSESSPPAPPADEEERARAAEGKVRWKGKWVPAAVREKEARKELDRKRKELEEARSHSEWKDRYSFATKNFAIESTQPESMNREFAERLEGYFQAFAKRFKVSVPRDWGKLKVCFYGGREDFLRTSGAGGGVLAYYRFVEPRELNFYYDRLDPQSSVDCLFHEATHYLIDLVDPAFQYPHWLNEAMAEYFGASEWDPGRKAFALGAIQHGRLAELRAEREVGKNVLLRDLVSDESGAYMHYYWGWSLVHFLMESPKYSKKFEKFFVDLATARDVDRRPHPSFQGMTVQKDGQECLKTFLSRMGLREKDLDGLQAEWYAWIDALPAGDVRALEEAGLRAYAEGSVRFRAPRLLKEAIDKGSTRTAVRVRYAICLLGKDEKEEAVRMAESAVLLDPLDAGVREALAFVLHQAGKPEEAQKVLALAKEIDPGRDFLDFAVMVKLAEGKSE
ncbi:MAG: DUF1570 domain-containing protein [Planctomycetaceae bacterium]|nr:DUF1570 domain-containing protein [Planctomycetota bacterium]NUN52108.1 DUF1570 domain-containing protein [Planctomycetaceae bacterium]